MTAVTRRRPTLDWLNVVALWLCEVALALASRRRYAGVRNLPATGPAIVVANHLSFSDFAVLATTVRRGRRRPRFLGMAEAFRWPVVGPVISRMGHIPVHRGTALAADSLAPALAALADGQVVALYPEGRITTEPDYRPLPTARTGAVRLALAADAPIVPVAQWGAHRLVTREHSSSLTRPLRAFGWLRRDRVARRPDIRVVVGAPIPAARLREVADPGGTGLLDYRAATEFVMAEVRRLLADIAGEDLPDLLGRRAGGATGSAA